MDPLKKELTRAGGGEESCFIVMEALGGSFVRVLRVLEAPGGSFVCILRVREAPGGARFPGVNAQGGSPFLRT